MPKRTQETARQAALCIRIDALHAAVCQAVGLLNHAPEIARTSDGRRVRDILRQALLDYADSATPAPEAPRAWAVSGAHPPRDYRPLYGDRPDDVKGASAPLTFGD